MISKLRFVLSALFMLAIAKGFAQAPNISYPSPQVYTTGVAITALTPTNTGGSPSPSTPVTFAFNFTDVRGIALTPSGGLYIADLGANEVKMVTSAGGGSATVVGSGFSKPSGVAVDAAGNVFVADNGNNAVKEILASNGSIVTLGSGFINPYGVAVDAAGNVYVTDTGNNLLKEIKASDGSVVTLATGFSTPTGIALDASANIYVTDRGNNAIKKIPAGGGAATTIATANGNPNGITVDAAGNVYFVDTNNDDVQEIPAGGGSIVYVGQGFNGPNAVAVDGSGNLFAASSTNGIIYELFKHSGYNISQALPAGLSFSTSTGTISGTPTAASPATNYMVTAYNASGSSTATINITVNTPTAPNLSYPTPQVYTLGVTIATITPSNSGGAVNGSYSVSPTLPRGLAFNTSTGAISGTPTSITAATNYAISASNSGGKDTAIIKITVNAPAKPNISYASPQTYAVGIAIKSQSPTNTGGAVQTVADLAPGLGDPRGLSVDIHGNVFVADYNGNYFEIPAAGGNVIYKEVVNDHPSGVVVDSAENLYVIQVSDGNVTVYPGNGGHLFYYAQGFQRPYGIARAANGDIYLSELIGKTVKKIASGSLTVSTLATGLNTPQGVSVDESGNVYVADPGANKVYEIPTSTGTLTSIGSGFSSPYDVAADAAGNVYVADLNNHAIKMIPAGGGTPIVVYSNPAINPSGITLDTNGNLYFSSRNSGSGTSGPAMVEEIFAPGSYTISPALPAGLVLNPFSGVISGTPTTVSPAANYTITATNLSGSSSTVVNIGVVADAGLAKLTLSKGTLSPAFASGTTSYTDMVTNGTASVTVTPTSADPAASITVNGTAVSSGSASGSIALAVGSNPVTIVVKSSDGTSTQTYSVNVIRPSTNAKLSALTVSSGTLTPVFNANTTSYTDAVSGPTSNITITPTVAVSGATITVNGNKVTSGSASPALPLAVGANTITTVVTAQDGVTTDTYTITVNRPSDEGDANLAALAISKGSLSPAFASGTTNYTDLVSNGTASITVTPTAANPAATIIVNGTAVASGSASGPITLGVGSNAITIAVRSQDGTTNLTYTVNVIRPSTNAKLAGLAISYGSLTPAFNTNTTSYSEFVPYSVGTMTLTPTVAVTGSTVTVNGVATASGSASAPVTLNVGTTVINTVVTAQDGITTNTYSLTITRPAGSTNDNLSALTVSKGTLSPIFNTSTLTYSDMVTNGTTSLTVTPTLSNANATMTVNGTAVASGHASGPISLSVGSNLITILVTAQNGTNTKTYKVTVIRPSTNAKLAAFTISSGTLTPAFNTNTTSYTASVTNATSSITVTPTVAVTGASVKVNGTAVASGSASAAIALSVGSNTITTVVTAQDGTTTDTYSLTVTRAAGPENIPDAAISVDKPSETLQLADDGISVHQGLSPNGDGINDFLQIDNIANYPENHLSIMNRNGQLVYEAKSYDNATKAFDGHSNKTGQMQLPGTYFYSLDYTVNGIVKHKTGFLVLKY